MIVSDSISFETSFSWTNYNKLPPVDEAFKQITTSNNFESFFSEIEDLALKHGVSDVIGIRLAHKHWLVTSDDIMLEKPAERHGRFALVTKATCRESVDTPVAPSCWLYGADKYEDYEYSTDEDVINAYKLLKTKNEFFKAFLEVAKKYHYEYLLVPTIICKESLETKDSDEETVLLETNINNESIVTVEKANRNLNSIPTSWSLTGSGSPVTRRCITRCEVKNGKHEVTEHLETWI